MIPIDNPILNTLFVIVAVPILLYGWYWAAQKAKSEAQKSKVPDLPSIPQMWDRLDNQDEKIQEQSARLFSQARHMAEQDAQMDEFKRQLALRDRREGTLGGWLIFVKQGILKGTIPPYPDEPVTVVEVLKDFEEEQ